MPTNCDETLIERYQREHEVYLGILARMTPQEIFDLELKHHNALAKIDKLEYMYDNATYVISRLLAIINSLDCHEVSCGCAVFQAQESIIDEMDTVCSQARKLLNGVKK